MLLLGLSSEDAETNSGLFATDNPLTRRSLGLRLTAQSSMTWAVVDGLEETCRYKRHELVDSLLHFQHLGLVLRTHRPLPVARFVSLLLLLLEFVDYWPMQTNPIHAHNPHNPVELIMKQSAPSSLHMS
jgi:hypothetical protein